MVGPILIPLYEGLISQLSNWQLSPPPPPQKKHNHLHGIRNTSKVLHMRPIQLSRPIPNPDEMCRRIIPLFPLVFS